MPKKNVSIPLAVACLSLLIWLFHHNIVEAARFFWDMNEAVAEKIKNGVTIVAAVFTVISSIVTIINFLRAPKPPASDKLLSDYYKKLHKSCERIDLSLVDIKFTEYARSVKSSITLPVVYQEMDAVNYLREEEGQKDADGGIKLRGQERKPLLQACGEDKYRRVVVLGDPGAGKSMFMDNLAWLVSATHLGEIDRRLPAEFRRLPVVRVRLRSAALLGKNQGFGLDLLLQAMQREIADLAGEANGEAVWRALETPLLEHGLILLDGLDEVPETNAMRADMLSAIDDLVTKLGPQARLIITSRPYVFEDQQRFWLDAFSGLELQPMSNDQIERFIDNWYRLLRETREYSEAVARRYAHQLFVDLQERDYLLDPARSPLILTLLTSLHFASATGILPHSRAELYQDAIALMLERWTQRIRRENPDYPLEDYERKALAESDVTRKTALQKLAMNANRNKILQIPDVQIKGLFADFVSPDANPNSLLDFIRYRSGILKPGQGNTFEFYHRSFQDYLAALDITEMDDWQDEMDRLLRQEGKDWWGEVFLLLVSAKVAGNSKPDAVALLLRYVPEVLDYAAYPQDEWQWLFLAARATIEQTKPLAGYASSQYAKLLDSLTRHLRALVEQGHRYVLPVALRAEAGRLLGELGDPRPGVTFIKDDVGKPKLFAGVKLPDIVWESIPTGEFRMGFSKEEAKQPWEKTATPAHLVTVSAFKISRYPVTNAQFACFVEAGGYEDERWWLEPPATLAWLKGGQADLSLLDDNPDLKKNYANWRRKRPAASPGFGSSASGATILIL